MIKAGLHAGGELKANLLKHGGRNIEALLLAAFTAICVPLTAAANMPLAMYDSQQLQAYVEKYPADPLGHYWMGRYCQKNGLLTQSELEYQQAVRQASGNPATALQLFKAAIQVGHLPIAVAVQGQVQAAFPNDPYVRYLQALQMMKQGRAWEAEPILVQISKQAPEIIGLPTALGLFAMGRRQFDLAVSLADGDLAAQPDNYQSNLLKAGALIAAGTCNGAVEPLSKVYKQTPMQTGIAEALSVCLLRAGKESEALEPTLMGLAMRKPNADKRTMQILKHLPGNFTKQAITEMGTRMDAIGLGSDFQFEIGQVLDRLGRHDEAVAHYQQCLSKAPNFARARFNLGKDYELYSHDYDKALDCYRRAIVLSPEESEYAARYQSLVNRLENRRQDLAWRLRDWLCAKFR